MKNILIVGHTSVDNIITPYMEKKNVLGGAALYSSLSSRIFTDKIKILTAIGKDFPDGYKHVLQRIDGKIVISEKSTTSFTIEYDETWHASYDEGKTVHGAGEEINPELIPEKVWDETAIIHIATMPPKQQERFKEEAMRRGIITSLDTYTGYIKKHKREVLDLIEDIDILWPNKEEAFLLTEIKDPIKSSAFLKENFHLKIVCVKQEGEGACICYDNKIKKVDAFKTKIQDPTGAGDCTSGGFLPIFIRTKDPLRSLVYGMAVASRKIQNFGADSLLKIKRKEIESLVNTRFNP